MAALVNDSAVAYSLIVTASVAIVTTTGLTASRCFIRHAAIRHCILLVALVCSLGSPVIVWGFMATNTTVVAIPLFWWEAKSSKAMALPLNAGSFAADPGSSVRGSSELLDSIVEVQEAEQGTPAKPSERSRASIVVASLFIWAIGVLSLLLHFACGLLRLRKLRRRCYRSTDSTLHKALQEARRRVGLTTLPDVLISPELRVPVVIGPLNPVVVFPEATLAGISPAAQSDVLVHELAHVIRRDHLVLLLQATARAVFWPVPPIHLLNRSLDIAREELCDNYVLVDREAVSYGETLLRLGEIAYRMPVLRSSIGAVHRNGKLEDRVLRLLDSRRNRMTRLNGSAKCALLAVFLLGTVLLCGTTIITAESRPTDEEKTRAAKPAIRRRSDADSQAEKDQTRRVSSAQDGDAESHYQTLGRFKYGQSLVGGTGTKEWTSGATLATLPPDEQGLSRFIFSFALDSNGPDLGALRVLARDENGNALPSEAIQSAAASGTGTANRVVTFVVAFKHSHDKIKELVIEERLPAGEKHSLRSEADSRDGAERKWVVVLGPIHECSLEPPADNEVLEFVDKASGARSGTSSGRARVIKQTIANYVDPPRFVPTIGPAQLHHIRYKCTVYFDHNSVQSVHSASKKSPQRVAYIKHSHFHLLSNEQRDVAEEIEDRE